ncbi:hypothetical protein CE91St62_30620 [Lachnospiraceae bacterium]|uniref:DUF4340 domain-containing protein n=1 Tax=Extibacter sp. GGCC_0201 TaxID=2731209 RepID=UPI001AA175CB|nr:DUF4340 domain-containing protein [Extibacter sp. GGCC_0201]MBO1721351.1 DUF4340 domain-containing protein [Extibacter sp. GGCC_0201]BDF34999.1 hypothetical protein CE91St61_30740 [Lachnospiraceae bacterium]BDF39001.1 hypothetical protein CE91St62_30620 [Lachnospiraceae bacterium]
MKQKKTIFVLAGILAVLSILYAGLQLYNKSLEKKEAEEAEKDKVYITNEEDIAEISYTGTEEDGTMSFVREDGEWYYAPDREIPLNQSTVQNMGDTLAACQAVRELEEPDDWSDYGLENPQYTIILRSKEGAETTLYIGQTAGEDYYAAVKGSGKVYTVDSTVISSLSFDLAQYVQTDTVPSISSGNLKKVEVTEGGHTTTYDAKEDMAEMAGGFGALSLTTCEDYHAEGGELKNYGLDEETRITVTAVYEDSASGKEEKYTIYIGATDDTGASRYVGTDGSRIVYLVSADTVDNTYTPAGQ